MNKNYDLVIWDWNGTLLNDAEIAFRKTIQVVKAHANKDVSLDDCRNAYTHPIANMYKKLGVDVSSSEKLEKVNNHWISLYKEDFDKISLKEGALEALKLLKQLRITQVLLSAFTHEKLILEIGNRGLAHYFYEVLGAPRISGEYRKVDSARKIMASLNMTNKSKSILFIGDSCHDAETAKECNSDCILVSCGLQSKESLLKTGFPVCSSLLQVIETLQK